MSATAWVACRTIDEALDGLERHGPSARPIAGGTDLMIELRRHGSPAATLIDLSRVAELAGIAIGANDEIRIGPLVTHAEATASPLLRRAAPLLAEACACVGSPQIRNRGTIGGNVMNAATCADSVPPLVALEAVATLRSPRGVRTLPVSALFVKPYVTRAVPGELLTGLSFAPLPAGATCAFVRLGRRNALAIARLSVAAVLVRDAAGVIRDARVVPGSAFPTWRRVSEAERVMVGERPSAELFAAAGAIVARAMVEETGRRWSTEYKQPVIAALARRALERCAPPAEAEVTR
jgi:CO/xanthine dehydrogenase FAD-binding subunit